MARVRQNAATQLSEYQRETAVLGIHSGLEPGSSAPEIDKLDIANGAIEEAGAEARKLFDGIGGEAADLGVWGCEPGGGRGVAAVDKAFSSIGSGFGGVDYLHSGGDGGFDELMQEGVVGAAKDQGVRILALRGGIGGEFVEVDFEDFGGDGVVGPAFLNPRHKEGA